MKKVIVVESAAKTKTIRRFLSGKFEVIACGGHIVDLPKDELGIEVEEGFKVRREPLKRGSKSKVKRLREGLQEADEIYLATDPDREGEAIAADLIDFCTPYGAQVWRIEFNAIVYRAVREALENPRELNQGRVEAQRARRTLDRLIGFIISSITQFDPSGPGLPSVGRVLAPAVALVVDREREIESFTVRHYWKLNVGLAGSTGELVASAAEEWEDFPEVKELALQLRQSGTMEVASVEIDEDDRQNPLPPYTTDMLQEEADNLLGFSPERTMALAQELYQGVEIDGTPQALITYMRTDSTRITPQALNQAREALEIRFDEEIYRGRSWKPRAGEQDAHEAIRPTLPEAEDYFPEKLEDELEEDMLALYRLIYFRFLASQSRAAIYRTTDIELRNDYLVASSCGHELIEAGFLKLYREIRPYFGKKELELPELRAGLELEIKRAWPEPEQTYPPARYREGGLVRTLKEKGIGRPSTYGNILEKIKRRRGGFGYLNKVRGRLRPTERGLKLYDYLNANFSRVISYEYTAGMERELDRIEKGESSYEEFLAKEFEWLQEPYEKSRTRGWLNGNRPTPAQVKFLKELEKRAGVEVAEKVYQSKDETSRWIGKIQDEIEPFLKLTGINEVDVSGVPCHRFKLLFNRPLPDDEKQFIKDKKLKYAPGNRNRLPGYQFQRQNYERVYSLWEELKNRYSGEDSPLEAEIRFILEEE